MKAFIKEIIGQIWSPLNYFNGPFKTSKCIFSQQSTTTTIKSQQSILGFEISKHLKFFFPLGKFGLLEKTLALFLLNKELFLERGVLSNKIFFSNLSLKLVNCF